MLSVKTKRRLSQMLTRKKLADEFEALLAAPAAPSKALKAAILSAMANKAAADEINAALAAGGVQALSGNPKNGIRSPNAARRFLDGIARSAEASEIRSQL